MVFIFEVTGFKKEDLTKAMDQKRNDPEKKLPTGQLAQKQTDSDKSETKTDSASLVSRILHMIPVIVPGASPKNMTPDEAAQDLAKTIKTGHTKAQTEFKAKNEFVNIPPQVDSSEVMASFAMHSPGAGILSVSAPPNATLKDIQLALNNLMQAEGLIFSPDLQKKATTKLLNPKLNEQVGGKFTQGNLFGAATLLQLFGTKKDGTEASIADNDRLTKILKKFQETFQASPKYAAQVLDYLDSLTVDQGNQLMNEKMFTLQVLAYYTLLDFETRGLVNREQVINQRISKDLGGLLNDDELFAFKETAKTISRNDVYKSTSSKFYTPLSALKGDQEVNRTIMYMTSQVAENNATRLIPVLWGTCAILIDAADSLTGSSSLKLGEDERRNQKRLDDARKDMDDQSNKLSQLALADSSVKPYVDLHLNAVEFYINQAKKKKQKEGADPG